MKMKKNIFDKTAACLAVVILAGKNNVEKPAKFLKISYDDKSTANQYLQENGYPVFSKNDRGRKGLYFEGTVEDATDIFKEVCTKTTNKELVELVEKKLQEKVPEFPDTETLEKVYIAMSVLDNDTLGSRVSTLEEIEKSLSIADRRAIKVDGEIKKMRALKEVDLFLGTVYGKHIDIEVDLSVYNFLGTKQEAERIVKDLESIGQIRPEILNLFCKKDEEASVPVAASNEEIAAPDKTSRIRDYMDRFKLYPELIQFDDTMLELLNSQYGIVNDLI